MATTRHMSLVGRGGRGVLVRDKGLAHTHTYTHTHYFLVSNKINDSTLTSQMFKKKDSSIQTLSTTAYRASSKVTRLFLME